jgi:hypothetical protein
MAECRESDRFAAGGEWGVRSSRDFCMCGRDGPRTAHPAGNTTDSRTSTS